MHKVQIAAPMELRPYLESQARARAITIDEYVVQRAERITSGNPPRYAAKDHQLITLAHSSDVDAADFLLISDALRNAGYDDRIRDITVGELVTAVQNAARIL